MSLCFRFFVMAVHSKNMFFSVLSLWPWLLLLLTLHGSVARPNRPEWDSMIRLPGELVDDVDVDEVGTRWAVLVAGSSGYGNYRHQVSLISLLIISFGR